MPNAPDPILGFCVVQETLTIRGAPWQLRKFQSILARVIEFHVKVEAVKLICMSHLSLLKGLKQATLKH